MRSHIHFREMPERHRELRQVAWFVGGAFAFTWALHGTLVASGMSVASGRALYRVGLLGPLVAALACTWKLEGRASVQAFLLRGLQLRAAGAASMCALLFPPVLYTCAVLSVGEGLPTLQVPAIGLPALVCAQAWVVLCEEPGWRGFAWPRLGARVGPLAAAVSLGLIWAAWHVPMFFVRDSRQQGLFAEFAVILVAWTLIMGALLRRSRGSYLPALLFHWSANVCAYVFELSARADERATALWLAAGVFAAICLQRSAAARDFEDRAGAVRGLG